MGPALSRPLGRRSKAYLKEADAILQRRREAAAPEDEGKMGRRALWAWGPGSALLPVVPPVPYPVPFAALSRARLRGSSVWALCCALRLTFRFRPSAAPWRLTLQSHALRLVVYLVPRFAPLAV